MHETLKRLSQQFSVADLLRSALPLAMQGANVPQPPPELLPMFEGKHSLEETVERLKKRETARATRTCWRQHPHALCCCLWLLVGAPAFGRQMALSLPDAKTATPSHDLPSQVKAMTDYMRKLHPGAVRVMLDERDEVLCNNLLGCEGTVVGVVGLAHLDGIERRWQEAMQKGSRIAAR